MSSTMLNIELVFEKQDVLLFQQQSNSFRYMSENMTSCEALKPGLFSNIDQFLLHYRQPISDCFREENIYVNSSLVFEGRVLFSVRQN